MHSYEIKINGVTVEYVNKGRGVTAAFDAAQLLRDRIRATTVVHDGDEVLTVFEYPAPTLAELFAKPDADNAGGNNA